MNALSSISTHVQKRACEGSPVIQERQRAAWIRAVDRMRRASLWFQGVTWGLVALALLLSQVTFAQGAPPIRWTSDLGAWVPTLAFSPDASLLAAASSYTDSNGQHGLLQLWDVATGAKLIALPTSAGTGVNGVAFSPDGKTLAASGYTHTANGDHGVLELWDVATKTLIGTLNTNDTGIYSVVFSPDGKTLAAGGSGATNLWDVASRTLVKSLHGNGIGYLAFSPDGKKLALECSIWDVASSRQLYSLPSQAGWQWAVAFSTDGSTLATTGNWVDGAIHNHSVVEAWSVSTGTLIKALDPGDLIAYSAAYAPDGLTLFAGNDHAVMVFDAKTNQLIHQYDQETGGGVSTIAFSRSGTPFAYANGNGTVVVADNPYARAVASLSLSKSSVTAGDKVTATVTLSSAAPAGGAVVTLASANSSAAAVPASVTVSAGATRATFTATTSGVATTTPVVLTATYNGTSTTATLTVHPILVTGLSLSPTSVIAGQTSTGTVTLNHVALTGGAVVSLSSASAAASVPATVKVAAGNTTISFTVKTSSQASSGSVKLTAALNGSSANATLTVQPVITKLTISPSTVIAGAVSQGTATISGPAPAGGASVKLTADAASASVPSTVVVPAGSTSVQFNVKTSLVTTSTAVKVTGSYNGATTSGSITIKPITVTRLSLSPTTVLAGQASVGTVTLSAAALSGGTVVSLSSSGATVPATLTIAGGQTTGTFQITTSPQNVSSTAKITATLNGSNVSATLTVKPTGPVSLTINPASVKGGNASQGTVTFSGAVSGGTLTLKSGSGIVQVPASVTIPANSTSIVFNMSTSKVTAARTVTLTASFNSTSVSATITVNP